MSSDGTIIFVYDGECPICRLGESTYHIDESLKKNLVTLDARVHSDHWLIEKIHEAKINLNDGMVIWDGKSLHHADAALRFMAASSKVNWVFNPLNRLLWRRERTSRLIYPLMRGFRSVLLWLKRVEPIKMELGNTARDQKPCREDDTPTLPAGNTPDSSTFIERALPQHFKALPQSLRRHYLLDSHETKAVVERVEGRLNFTCKTVYRIFSPLFKVFGLAPLVQAPQVATQVYFGEVQGAGAGAGLLIDRYFALHKRGLYRFQSHMHAGKDARVIEKMRGGIQWHSRFSWEDETLKITHLAYAIQLFRWPLRLPLEYLLGIPYAEEWSLSEDSFGMFVKINHPILGLVYGYEGQFQFVAEE